jgi:tetratricopeptide (TPR) repeat protein
MNRLWQIALPLACCLVGAALWTALLRDTGQLPNLREAIETARYLDSIQDRLQTPRPKGEAPSDRFHLASSQEPAHHAPVDVAEPLASRTEQWSPIAATPTLAEPDAIATSGTEDSEARVSIIQWSGSGEPKISSTPELPSPAVSSAESAVQLSPQDRQIAGLHLHYGKILARKGATSSARGEFLNALNVIAQSRDLQHGDKSHLSALQRAIRTLDEADDFHANRSGSDLDTNVATIVDGHLCQVLNAAEATRVPQSEAIATYHASARADLERACGTDNPLASEVLFALGRLHGLLGQSDPTRQPSEYNKSITFHQAALTANPNNFASANELGVLLARKGEWAQAKDLLVRSVTLSPRRETWANLAALHQRLGEAELAQLANREAQLLAAGNASSNPPMIRLVPPAEFEAVPDTQEAGPPNQTAQQPASPSANQWR